MADNASRYRSAYAQRKSDQLAEDLARAEAELKALYEDSEAAQAAWSKRLDEELKIEREYLLELQRLAPKQYGKIPGKDGDKDEDGGGVDLDALKVLKDVAVARSNAASEDATRKVNLIKIHDDSWTAPSSVVRTLNEDVQAVKGDLAGVRDDVAQVTRHIESRLSNERLAPAVAALETVEQRKDAAIKYSQALSASAGVSEEVAKQATANAFGLSLEDLNPLIFAEDKADARKDIEKKAYAGGTQDLDFLSRELKKKLEERGATTLASQASAQATSKASAYLADPRWQVVKAALDDGKITIGEDVINPVTGEKEKITSDDILDYQQAARDIATGTGKVPPLDAQFFDPVFLERIGKEREVTKRIEAIEAERAAGYPGEVAEMPTIEAVRRRAAEINAPHRYLTPKESRSEGAQARTMGARLGTREADERAGVPSTLSDQQRATIAAGRSAIQLVRSNPDWEKDESDTQAKARQVRGLVDSGLQPAEVYKKIAELADGDTEVRDDIYSRVLAYEVARKEREKVAPTPLPGVTGETLISPAELEKKRRQQAIEELSRIGAEGI